MNKILFVFLVFSLTGCASEKQLLPLLNLKTGATGEFYVKNERVYYRGDTTLPDDAASKFSNDQNKINENFIKISDGMKAMADSFDQILKNQSQAWNQSFASVRNQVGGYNIPEMQHRIEALNESVQRLVDIIENNPEIKRSVREKLK